MRHVDRLAPGAAGRRIVVMGVTGAGKSAVGAALADAIGVDFLDGDDLHPPRNRERLTAGIPLTDADRAPWLAAVGAALAAAPDGLVVACSALRRRYRDTIRGAAPGTVFVHLTGPRSLLAARLAGRTDHFMPTGLLDSQLATLEPLGADEAGLVVDVAPPVADIVTEIVRRLPTDAAPRADA